MAAIPLQRFVALYDLHWGYERKGGRLHELHDPRALAVAMAFIGDFNPHHIILGGDMLDCGAISHHNDRKPGCIEGLRVDRDAEELRHTVLEPLERRRSRSLTYLIGNHEDWLNQIAEVMPGLGTRVSPEALLGLGPKWKVVQRGGFHRLGKLIFKHGDTIKGGEHAAKAAVISSERSIRFGHRHTFAAYTKLSDVDLKQKHTGISLPCLAQKGPGYGQGQANRWVSGFNYGWILPGGAFSDYVPLIINNRAVIEGKLYCG